MTVIRAGALLAAALTTGLSAGLFYAYFFSVMPGLGATDDRTFVGAMQSINIKILNGWFVVAFLGPLVFTVLAGALHVDSRWRSVLPWIVAALVLYLLTLLITFGANVPLNNALAAAGEPDGIADLAAVRQRFEDGWVRWNVARTVTSIAAFGCLAWALVRYGQV